MVENSFGREMAAANHNDRLSSDVINRNLEETLFSHVYFLAVQVD